MKKLAIPSSAAKTHGAAGSLCLGVTERPARRSAPISIAMSTRADRSRSGKCGKTGKLYALARNACFMT